MRRGLDRGLLLLALIALAVAASADTLRIGSFFGEGLLADLLLLPAMAGFVLVGGLIVYRRAGNRVGWMLLLAGTSLAVGLWAETYAEQAHAVQGGAGALAVAAAWLGTWFLLLPIGLLFVFLPLYFPDGRLPSPRWRPLAWAAWGQLGLLMLAYGLTPGPMSWDGGQALSDNPVGIEAAGPYVRAVIVTLEALFVPVMLAVVAAVTVRWRRSVGVERQQMKWFLAAVTVLGAYALLVRPLQLPPAALGITLLALPGAVGTAVMRHRLYEIDRIVSRTVTYTLLTGLLAGIYAVGIVGLGGLVRGMTGAESNEVSVAASTLAAAAAFVPARRRIQTAVDRRFRRRRHDAAMAIDHFGQRLRDEVDLDLMGEELIWVVRDIFHPASVRLWLRREST
jgi:hypothetical protein